MNLFDFPATEWKIHRRLVSPLINVPSLQAYFPIFNHQIKKTVIDLPITDGYFDILPYLLNCSVTMFTEASLGSEIEPSAKQKYIQRLIE